MGTGYQPENIVLGTDGYWVPAKFSTMSTSGLNNQKFEFVEIEELILE